MVSFFPLLFHQKTNDGESRPKIYMNSSHIIVFLSNLLLRLFDTVILVIYHYFYHLWPIFNDLLQLFL